MSTIQKVTLGINILTMAMSLWAIFTSHRTLRRLRTQRIVWDEVEFQRELECLGGITKLEVYDVALSNEEILKHAQDKP